MQAVDILTIEDINSSNLLSSSPFSIETVDEMNNINCVETTFSMK